MSDLFTNFKFIEFNVNWWGKEIKIKLVYAAIFTTKDTKNYTKSAKILVAWLVVLIKKSAIIKPQARIYIVYII